MRTRSARPRRYTLALPLGDPTAGTLAQTGFTTVSVGCLAPALRSDYGLTLGETGVVLGAVGIGMLLTLLP
jgi:hypothetical protein